MKPYLLVLAIVATASSHASEWKYLGATEKVDVSIDTETIISEGKHLKAWVGYNYKVPEPIADGKSVAKSHKSLEYFMCDVRKSGIKSIYYYSDNFGEGNIVAKAELDDNKVSFKDHIPDTAGSTILNFVCGFKPTPDKKAPSKNSENFM